MKEKVFTVEPQKRPQILLTGNGFNYFSKNNLTWGALLDKIKSEELSEEDKKIVKKMPYNLQPVILTNDNIDEALTKNIVEQLKDFEPSEKERQIINNFLKLGFSSILTTNYTYELEKTIKPDFSCNISKTCKYRHKIKNREKKFVTNQMETYFLIEDKLPAIWHIHGECAKPRTMILGFYWYGKLLSKIQQYISIFLRQYNGVYAKSQNFVIQNWVDYFMMGDVYIVGQGLDLSETDLWWLINCKKLHCKDTNIYWYNPNITLEQRALANAYGIKISNILLKDGNYFDYYKNVSIEIENIMENLH